MKAVIINSYGDAGALQYAEAERPVAGTRQVVIRIHAAGINPVDWKIRNGQLKMVSGSRFPKILGGEVAGEVVSTGWKATKFNPGDQVYAMLTTAGGGYAEYVALDESKVAFKPKNMSFEEAASVPLAAITALVALRDKGGIKPAMKVLVNGASGGVGSFAVQIARVYGAYVTGVCSTANVEMVKQLGAQEVIDYKKRDFTTDERLYDIVFDAVASRSFDECKRILHKPGTYISTLPTPATMLDVGLTLLSLRKAKLVLAPPNAADLDWLRKHIEEGSIKTIIDKVYPLSQAAEAHRYSESGRVKGKIVLTVNSHQ